MTVLYDIKTDIRLIPYKLYYYKLNKECSRYIELLYIIIIYAV